MNLEDLLRVMDRAAANLAKLQAIWDRAEPMIPTGPQRGTTREYEDLRRVWGTLVAGLPPIDGYTVTEQLPDIDVAGQTFMQYWELSEPAFGLRNELEKPGREIDEYRFRLGRARRMAIHDRLDFLISTVSTTLAQIVETTGEDSGERIDNAGTRVVEASIAEVERLLGDTIDRKGRWSDLHRHLRFSQPHDWRDVAELDWPSVRSDIEAASLSESDPLPVPNIDLGVAASAKPAGGASVGIEWSLLDDDGFERLLFDLFGGFSSYQNVDWLMKTRAPDRGRDLAAERVLRDEGGTTRTERVIVQAKHWTARSVAPTDILTSLATLPIWEPPVIRVLIIATSGRFTADAVTIVERHNDAGKLPFIELWAESRLETLLSQRPDLIASYRLRE
ncbi:restriction endonuclease [Microbacterium sp. NPDC057650]|uniref:restriction endonuclease n=1 Tax=unclassified Microbacterium TaxID=2609290 RepID=UPI00366D03AA